MPGLSVKAAPANVAVPVAHRAPEPQGEAAGVILTFYFAVLVTVLRTRPAIPTDRRAATRRGGEVDGWSWPSPTYVLVEVMGVEPTTSSMRPRRSSQLSYTPRGTVRLAADGAGPHIWSAGC